MYDDGSCQAHNAQVLFAVAVQLFTVNDIGEKL